MTGFLIGLPVGMIIGYAACALFTMSKISDLEMKNEMEKKHEN